MKTKIVVILRKPPYGDLNAAEAVRHAMGGGASDELDVALLMLDAGVLVARKGQSTDGVEITNLGAALRDCIDMGVALYADKASLMNERLEEKDIAEGISVIGNARVAELIGEANATMIF